MKKQNLEQFLERLGLEEEPMGIFFTDEKPLEGFSPKVSELPTREKEKAGLINWEQVFSSFSCTMGHIWRARKKHCAAYFSREQFGCAGAAFWMGFTKPQTETIVHYVSTGIPNWSEGEWYCSSPEELRKIFEYVDPEPVPETYCVIKPISLFEDHERPELVVFFSRPESLCGLHQLATFVTNDPEVVQSPWSAACGSLLAWPMHYASRGQEKAVIGGWDPSARKFLKNEELTFTIPFSMFEGMIANYEKSFLGKKGWETVRKKIARSNSMLGA